MRSADHRAGLVVHDQLKDPGTLGFYGFRNRADHSYDGLTFATAEK